MNDIFFSLDQQLANKLVDSLKIPLTIDVLKPKYFNQDETGEVDDNDPDVDVLESDLFEASLRALEYAENRDETLSEKIEEDEELYNIAKLAVDAFLLENPTEMESGDKAISNEYSFDEQKGLWGKLKKYAKKAGNWLKKQAKKAIKIKSVKLERFEVTVQRKPVIVISNPVKINDVYLYINYRITVKYEILRMGGRISLSDNFKMPNTDLNIKFSVNGLQYLAEPHFTSLKIVKYIVGFKVTIGLAKIVNKKIKPMVIFDASKYLPEIPWFEKSFVPEPPLGLSTYNSGLSFGVNFKLKE
jgi:hypothetical protein